MMTENVRQTGPGEQTFTATRTITDADVALFALITGDQQPLHLDVDYAETTRFAQRIVPVSLIAGLVEATLATALPAGNALVQRQMLAFPHPALIDEDLVVTLTVQAHPLAGYSCCAVKVTRPTGEVVATGEVEAALEAVAFPVDAP